MAQAKERGGQAVQAIYDNVTAGKEIPAITFHIPAAVMTKDNSAGRRPEGGRKAGCQR